MVLSGYAKLVGCRSGKKGDKTWCSVVLDALDDPMERVQYFVPDTLVGKVMQLPPGDVLVEARIYPMKDGMFGSRLVDINCVEAKK